ncbi:uncharacterized protein [Drosophila suzukii]|uniref:Uncharacterized protein isoform X2 n=1 Tax=Drosophila suzukii TaxID=28584 RepID=A0AB40DNG3_DROSZ
MSSRKEHNLSAVRLPVRRGLHKDLWEEENPVGDWSQDAIRYIVGFWGQTVAAVDVSDCPLDRSPASASRKETHQPPPAGCNSHTKGFT